MAVLLQLSLRDLAHLGHSFMLGHDLHILMVRLSMLAHVLDGLVHLLLPELGTHSSVFRRRVDLNIEVGLVAAH